MIEYFTQNVFKFFKDAFVNTDLFKCDQDVSCFL